MRVRFVVYNQNSVYEGICFGILLSLLFSFGTGELKEFAFISTSSLLFLPVKSWSYNAIVVEQLINLEVKLEMSHSTFNFGYSFFIIHNTIRMQ